MVRLIVEQAALRGKESGYAHSGDPIYALSQFLFSTGADLFRPVYCAVSRMGHRYSGAGAGGTGRVAALFLSLCAAPGFVPGEDHGDAEARWRRDELCRQLSYSVCRHPLWRLAADGGVTAFYRGIRNSLCELEYYSGQSNAEFIRLSPLRDHRREKPGPALLYYA